MSFFEQILKSLPLTDLNYELISIFHGKLSTFLLLFLLFLSFIVKLKEVGHEVYIWIVDVTIFVHSVFYGSDLQALVVFGRYIKY